MNQVPAGCGSRASRVLIVDDEPCVVDSLEYFLTGVGFVIHGQAATVRQTLDLLAERGMPDVAILDLLLGCERVDPVAETLAAAGVPFLFFTGVQDDTQVPVVFRGRPRLVKPVSDSALCRALADLLAD